MKVYISKYRDHWYSPYTFLEKVVYRRKIDYDDPTVDKWAKRLEPVSLFIQKVLDFIHPRVEYVKIDRWDTWNMDHTLGMIVLPMLKQLKATKHGSPFVKDEDVPEELRSTSAPPKENDYDIDGNHHKRWEYVLDEMIFAFEHKLDDSWQDQYRSGNIDFTWVTVDAKGNEVPKGEHKYFQMKEGPNHTYECDYDAIALIEKRIDNGFRLFGTYYRGLWD